MGIKILEILIIVVFTMSLWGVDKLINKFENKNKK
jgi:hypothetical protein